jgi:rhomboid family GlyGly-CTERM serine protease
LSPLRRFPWVTVGTVAACALASSLPGGGELLQYDRARVADGELWRLLTGQTVHWSVQMTLMDLGALLLLGSWLENRHRRRAVALALGLAAVLTAAALPLLLRGLELYRGSSGAASALFVLASLDAMRPPARPGPRGLALGALFLFGAKIAWEASGGPPLAAGELPPGVAVTPLIHLLGGLAGVVAGFRHRASTTVAPTQATT